MGRLDLFKDNAPELLGVVGTFVGAAIGGVPGAIKGGALGYGIGSGFTDTEDDVFDPPPRLEPLELQTAEYNTDIYRAYGDNLIAGNLEWLKGNETHIIEKDGTSFHAATFAISLQSGAIGGITKIFANGKLIYNVTGDVAVALSESEKNTGVKIYGKGSANTLPDEIRVAEDDDDLPAFRNVVLVVFSDFQLTDYNNAIPAFQFVTSDAGSATSIDPKLLRIISGGEALPEGDVTDPRASGIEVMPWWYDGGVLNSLKVLEGHLPTYSFDGGVTTYTNVHVLLKIRGSADATNTLYSEEFILLEPDAFDGGIYNNDYDNVRVYPCTNTPGTMLVSWRNTAGEYRSATGTGQNVLLRRMGHLFTTTAFFNVRPFMDYADGYLYICTGGSTSIGSSGQRDGVDGFIQVDLRQPEYPREETERNTVPVKSYATKDYMTIAASGTNSGIGHKILAVDTTGVNLDVIDGDSMALSVTYALPTQAIAGNMFVMPAMSFFIWGLSYKSTTGDWVTVDFRVDRLIGGSWEVTELGTVASNSGTDQVVVVQYSAYAGFTRSYSTPWDYDATLGQDMIAAGEGVTDSTNISVADTLAAELSLNPYLDHGDVDLSDIADEELGGYVVTGRGSLSSVIKPLMKGYQFGVYESDYQIKFRSRSNGVVVATIPATDLQAHELGSREPDQAVTVVRPDQAAPSALSVGHVNPALDYEKDAQLAERLNTINNSQQEVNLPLVMSADKAVQTAHILLENLWMENQGIVTIRVSFKYSYIEVEDLITVTTDTNTYNLRVIDIEKGRPGIVVIQGVVNDVASYSSTADAADSPFSQQSIAPTAGTVLQLVDCVALRDGDVDFGLYYATFPDNPSGTWVGSEVHASIDAQRWNSIGTLNNSVTLCTTLGELTDTGTVGIYDETETLDVKPVNGTIETVTEEQAANGANLAAYGDAGRWEIIKFITVTDNGDETFTISRILRGYYGTEHAMGLHQQGDKLIVFSTSTWNRFTSRDSSLYQTTQYYKAVTNNLIFNNNDSTVYTSVSEARILRAPSHLKATRNASSDIQFSWFRTASELRQWVDADWTDSNTHNFEVDVLSGAGGSVLRTLSVSGSNAPFTVDYTSAQQVADFGSNQTSIYINVYQLDDVTGRGYAGEGQAI